MGRLNFNKNIFNMHNLKYYLSNRMENNYTSRIRWTLSTILDFYNSDILSVDDITKVTQCNKI